MATVRSIHLTAKQLGKHPLYVTVQHTVSSKWFMVPQKHRPTLRQWQLIIFIDSSDLKLNWGYFSATNKKDPDGGQRLEQNLLSTSLAQ